MTVKRLWLVAVMGLVTPALYQTPEATHESSHSSRCRRPP